MFRKALLLFTLLFLMIPLVIAQEAEETAPQFIELVGPASERNAEISSLVWYNDWLIFITENPFIYRTEGNVGMFFALEKDDILDYLAEDNPEPLEPRPVPLYGKDILQTVNGFAVAFDGFEAAVVITDRGFFVRDQIFLAIEADTVNRDDPTMRSYLVSGQIRPGLSGIDLNLDDFIEIPRQTDFNNMAYENMMLVGNTVVATYEANGATVNENPVAYQIDLLTGELSTLPFPNINWRVTDGTAHDENGVFWVINYFFSGEDFLAVESDPLFEQYGMGASQAEFDGFERLVALQYTDDGIELVDTPPIQLLMTEDSRGRNWEGIVRLDDMGFLIITDRWPQTLLAFVPTN